MSNDRKPLFRLKYRSKDGQKFDFGTVWPGRFPDSHDVKFETQTTSGQYPKMAVEEVAQRLASRDGFASLVSAAPRQQRQPQGGNGGGFGDGPSDFDESDIPF